jgi:very-short-patch-repair endonuclease
LRGLRIPETRRARGFRRAQTPAEARLWSKLRNRGLAGYKFVRQEPIGPYFADFLCRECALIVEVDGATHSTEDELHRDAHRTEFLESKGYNVFLFALSERPAPALHRPAPHPSPLPAGGERE